MWTSSSSSSSSASTSFSSSTSSSPSPYSTLNSNPKTMEEVWRDITLASDIPHHPSAHGVILQDFFSKDPPPPANSSSGFASSPPPPPPPPPTMLTLNSATHHFSSLFFQPHHHPIPHVSSLNPPFDALVSDDNCCGGKKRFPDSDRSSGDRRHKRMIKNRESAARSRARKQESIFTRPNFNFFNSLQLS
ncbi:UNVERIFIED_CONTAM: Protein FD [Sesamum indicum]